MALLNLQLIFVLVAALEAQESPATESVTATKAEEATTPLPSPNVYQNTPHV